MDKLTYHGIGQRRGQFMTGEELLNKVRSIKSITDIHWYVEGNDVLNPYLVKVVVISDSDKFEMTYPLKDEGIQFAAIALLINKFMELRGESFRITMYDDIANAVNQSRKLLKNS